MKIPQDAIISDSKITQYLLVYKPQNDKSAFLARAGFTKDNPEDLRIALQKLISRAEAVEDRNNEYGIYYQVEGFLIGADEEKLAVVTIWLKRRVDEQFQFVTLKPKRR